MANIIELRYQGRDPQSGRFRREVVRIPLTDGSTMVSVEKDRTTQTYILTNPEVVESVGQEDECVTKMEGVLFRFQANDSDEVFFIPEGLDLDINNLTDIFGEKTMSYHRFVSLNTE